VLLRDPFQNGVLLTIQGSFHFGLRCCHARVL